MLGILSHYIADASVPQHVIDGINGEGIITKPKKNNNHKTWEEWFGNVGDFAGGPSATFPNGGPDWDDINPRKYDSVNQPDGLKRAPLFPLPPYEAVVDMAHITFTGWDHDNGFGPEDYPESAEELKEATVGNELKYKYAAFHMFVDPAQQGGFNGEPHNWGENLLKWAVYYTACAYLWVMKEVKKRGKTIGDTTPIIQQALGKRQGITSGYGNRATLYTPLYGDDWKKQYEDKYIPQSPHYDNQAIQGLMISAGLLVPALSLILIPMGIRGAKNTITSKKEDPWKVDQWPTSRPLTH